MPPSSPEETRTTCHRKNIWWDMTSINNASHILRYLIPHSPFPNECPSAKNTTYFLFGLHFNLLYNNLCPLLRDGTPLHLFLRAFQVVGFPQLLGTSNNTTVLVYLTTIHLLFYLMIKDYWFYNRRCKTKIYLKILLPR
jgi:hypothetical protein